MPVSLRTDWPPTEDSPTLPIFWRNGEGKKKSARLGLLGVVHVGCIELIHRRTHGLKLRAVFLASENSNGNGGNTN